MIRILVFMHKLLINILAADDELFDNELEQLRNEKEQTKEERRDTV